MKKIVSLFLAFMLCLSLCSCGEQESNVPVETKSQAEIYEEALLSEVWKDVYQGTTLTFFDDGTVNFNNFSTGTWNMKGSQLFTTSSSGLSTVYSIINENEILRLVPADESKLFVAESNYEKVFATIERPVGRITDHEGNVVELTARELLDIEEKNDAVFKKLYKGADITIVGTVESVSTNVKEGSTHLYIDIIEFKDGWRVDLLHDDANEQLLLSLNAGDKVEVKSQICSTLTGIVKLRGTNKDGSYGERSMKNTVVTPVK